MRDIGRRRVVVTGMGVLTPYGRGVRHAWSKLCAGHSGIRPITNFDVTDLPVKIGGAVPRSDRGDQGVGVFDPRTVVDAPTQRRFETFILYALAAAKDATAAAGLSIDAGAKAERIGVLFGSGIGGAPMIRDVLADAQAHGPRRIPPWFVPGILINMASGLIALKHGFKGPNHAVATACATGTHAIGDAATLIALGRADAMVAGASEASVNRVHFSGFAATRALSTRGQEAPGKASRPFDSARDGFVLGEGAGAVVLEAMDHAEARGAPILGEVIGYGLSGDAHHILAPDPEGRGAEAAMQASLDSALITANDVHHVNAHATGTQAGDSAEANALRRLFRGSHPVVSATKGATGHLLGAAGAVEMIFALAAAIDRRAPPTLNLDDPDPSTRGLRLARSQPQGLSGPIALSNSFGFGGTNACLIVQALTDRLPEDEQRPQGDGTP